MILFAVHISDYVLSKPWEAGGFVLAALLVWLGSWRIRDDEIPRIAVLTAAFFISSLIHIRVGPTSIHLLLTGLVGVVLGSRAALAIFVGLLLQVMLIGHGGWFPLGVNTCVMTCPALLCWLLFQATHRIPWIKTPSGRGMLVGFGAMVWFMSGVYSLTLISNTSLTQLDDAALALANALELANSRLLDPWIVGGMLLFAGAAILLERRFETTPEFPLGFLIGELSVLLTVALNCVVLVAGGESHWHIPPLVLVIAHLPFAVVEGVILGLVVGFLAKVKPEMLGIVAPPFSRAPVASADAALGVRHERAAEDVAARSTKAGR
jgi:ABC-type Co2+ transport system permease subunit